MGVRVLEVGDLDWAVALLQERRTALVPFAPLFWRPSEHAARSHRAYLSRLLTRGGAVGYRTASAVLIAMRQTEGWIVDDAWVPGDRWATDPDASDLWAALADDHRGDRVRLVCPVYESARAEFAVSRDLHVENTWWLRELPGSTGGTAGETVELPGASARTSGAPPVYAPPGPMLFLHGVAVPGLAVPAAVERAPGLGCAGIVVDQPADDHDLGATLIAAGFRAHCAYYTGIL